MRCVQANAPEVTGNCVPKSIMSGMLFLLFTTSLFRVSPCPCKVRTCIYEQLVAKIRECGVLANPFFHYFFVFLFPTSLLCCFSASYFCFFSISFLLWQWSGFAPQNMPVRPCRLWPPPLSKKSVFKEKKKSSQRERNIRYLKAAHIKLHRYYASCCNINLMWRLTWDWIRVVHFEGHYSLALKQPFQLSTKKKHILHTPACVNRNNISTLCKCGIQGAIDPQSLNASSELKKIVTLLL